jgi:hypothetical protein
MQKTAAVQHQYSVVLYNVAQCSTQLDNTAQRSTVQNSTAQSLIIPFIMSIIAIGLDIGFAAPGRFFSRSKPVRMREGRRKGKRRRRGRKEGRKGTFDINVCS